MYVYAVKNTIRDAGSTALYTAKTVFTMFILFKLLYTALTVACMPMDIVREGRVTLIVGLPP